MIVSRDEYFEGLNNQYILNERWRFSQFNFWLSFEKKIQNNTSAASMISLTSCENPLQKALIAVFDSKKLFRKPPVMLKIVPVHAMNVHWRKSTNESEGKPEQKFDVTFVTVFKISKSFQRSKQKIKI